MEKNFHTPQNPAKSWNDLEQAERQEVLDKAPGFKKAGDLSILALAGVLALSSCGGDKSVEQQVNSIIKDKQDQIDDLIKKEARLKKKESDIKQDIKTIQLEKAQAEKELREAQRLKNK